MNSKKLFFCLIVLQITTTQTIISSSAYPEWKRKLDVTPKITELEDIFSYQDSLYTCSSSRPQTNPDAKPLKEPTITKSKDTTSDIKNFYAYNSSEPICRPKTNPDTKSLKKSKTAHTSKAAHTSYEQANIYAYNSSDYMISLPEEQSEPEAPFDSTDIDEIFNQHKQNVLNCLKQDESEKSNLGNIPKNLLSGSAGVIAATSCLCATKILESMSESQKRIFIIDDLMAAGAANATLQAILPTAFALIAGIFTYRQIDYYLHAEERSHFVVLEHKFENAFKEIKQNVIKEFAARDKKYTGEYKKIFKYVDDSSHKIVQNLEHELASLQKHQSEQADLIQDIKNDVHENNDHLQERIIRAQQSSEKAVIKITELQGTIAEYKQNYTTMTATFQKIHPLVMAMHAKMMTPSNSHQQLMSIQIPQSENSDADDEKEEKADNTPRTTKPAPLKKTKSAWHNLMNSITGQKNKK
jgi:hypothetical protein